MLDSPGNFGVKKWTSFFQNAVKKFNWILWAPPSSPNTHQKTITKHKYEGTLDIDEIQIVDNLPDTVKMLCVRLAGPQSPNTWPKGILLTDLQIWTATLVLPWVSSLLAHPADLGLAGFHNHMCEFKNSHITYSQLSVYGVPAYPRYPRIQPTNDGVVL